MSDSMIVLGIDCSTQSLSAAVLEIPRDVSGGAAPRTLFEQSVVFTQDPRTNAFGVDPDTLILPPQFPGQADQPPGMFLAALDAVLSDLQSAGAPLDRIAAIQISAQQHGHVYLSASAKEAFQSVASGACGKSLVEVFTDSYSYPSCPIWLTSSTKNEADDLRQRIGGKAAMIETSGSDSPLRFSGAVIRKVGLEFPKQYEETRAIRLLSAFLSGVLCGKMDVPADWGNASGTSLMDYRARDWSPQLIEAAAADLPDGSQALREKLGEVAHPLSWAGPIAQYFHERFGIPIDCKVGIGSGDNPQSKVGTSGDLLSLGTSFVFMIEQDTPSVDPQGFSNSMYDGLGRPFIFACRTNGAAVWDQICSTHGVAPGSYQEREAALQSKTPDEQLVIWQPRIESFPVSPEIPVSRTPGTGDFASDYAGVIDSSLGILWYYTKDMSDSSEPLKVTGGPTASRAICERVASMWRRPVVRVGASGAAYGAALAAAAGLFRDEFPNDDPAERISALLQTGDTIQPDPELIRRYHTGGDAYVPRLIVAFSQRVQEL